MKTWNMKPATSKELAELYGMSYRVFKNHLDSLKPYIGIRIGSFLNIKQILIIFQHMGPPPFVNIQYSSIYE